MDRPSCACCYDDEFDARVAERDLRIDRRRGPGATTRALADALANGGAVGRTVLDIGGGIGRLHRLLLEAGAASAVDVDASRPYLQAAQREAERLGLAERVRFVHGDAVAVGSSLEPADLVALDRVVCCYADAAALVGMAAELTRVRLGIVVPPDSWPARLVIGAINVWQRVLRSRLRMHAHPHATITRAAAGAGLRAAGVRSVGMWRLLVFERPPGALPGLSSAGSR
jgi:SAM-dependent methyltransferase